MKKLVAVLIAVCCVSVNADERYAHEYSSENHENERSEWYESETRGKNLYSTPRYQQNYQQPPIQIYLSPNINSYSGDSYSRSRIHRNSSRDRNYQEERYWRERRYELQQMPKTPYYENQFDRDDTHW